LAVELHCHSKSWRVDGGLHVRGQAFAADGERVVSAEEWPELVLNPDRLTEVNGFFAIVSVARDEVFLAADHIRSMPLFYAHRGDDILVSDDAEWIRRQLGATEIDPVAADLFARTGYVTGHSTLIKEIHQVQAGEWVRLSMSPDGPQKVAGRYYRFIHADESADGPEQLEAAVVAAHRRVIAQARGRQLVVPLSGGYDSRLIATMLVRLGYKNIVTFTYGRAGNVEAKISRDVATALGLPWAFVEYTPATWRAWRALPEWQEFQLEGGNWSSLPHVQDWPAVLELKARGFIAPDAVFVPGHAADFVCGGHLPVEVRERRPVDAGTFSSAILRDHLKEAGAIREPTRYRARIEGEVLCRPKWSVESVADAFEEWDWQERQAKYIGNSVRVYEYFGHDWWMPFWDREFVKVFEKTPLERRIDHRWYGEFVAGAYAKMTNVSAIDAAVTERETTRQRAINWLKAWLPASLEHGLRVLKEVAAVRSHPMANFGAPYRRFCAMRIRQGATVIGVLAAEHLDVLGAYAGRAVARPAAASQGHER